MHPGKIIFQKSKALWLLILIVLPTGCGIDRFCVCVDLRDRIQP